MTFGEAQSAWGDVLGWRTSIWLGIAALTLSIAVLSLLITGPEPRHATKWAWFWMFTSSLGILAVVAYLAFGLGGKPRPGERRLTGGWAFLLSIIIPRPW